MHVGQQQRDSASPQRATRDDRALATPTVAPAARRQRQLRSWWSPLWVYLLADLSALGAASAVTARGPLFTISAMAFVVIGLRLANLYRRMLIPSAGAQLGRIAPAVASGSLAAAALTGASARAGVIYAGVAGGLLCIGRGAACIQARRTMARRPERTIMVGTGQAGQEFASRLLDHPEHGIVPLGFVDTDPAPLDPSLPLTVLAPLGNLSALVQQLDVQRIVLDAGSVAENELFDVLDLAAGLKIEVSVLPVLTQHLSTSVAVDAICGSTLLSYRPSPHYGISWSLKRAIDIVGALAMLIVTAPVWAVVAIAIKLDSAGPTLYKQERVGRHGRSFTIYKFRSMHTDADAQKTLYLDLNEADGPYFKLRSDPRITRVGRVIRHYSIDEIPQLLNVVRGDMSMVGPRPSLASEVAEYPQWLHRRLAVRPGLTGLWQVSGRFLLSFQEGAGLDVNYVDHWSLALDLQILARTPGVVVSGHGAG